MTFYTSEGKPVCAGGISEGFLANGYMFATRGSANGATLHNAVGLQSDIVIEEKPALSEDGHHL